MKVIRLTLVESRWTNQLSEIDKSLAELEQRLVKAGYEVTAGEIEMHTKECTAELRLTAEKRGSTR